MDYVIDRRVCLVKRLTKGDIQYQRINRDFLRAETEFFDLISELSIEQQYTIWKYLNLLKEQNFRTLEIACEYIDFNG